MRQPVGFLFDEPLSNLDAKLRVHMRAELAQLHRQLKATFVYVTHDQAEAMTMSSRIAVMIEGHIVQIGTPAEVYENPRDIRVAEFVGSPKINVMPGLIRADGGLEVLGRPLGLSTAAPAGRCSICVRPERIEPGTGSGAISGTVVHLENLGAEAFVHVKVDRVDLPLVARLNPDRQLPAIGSAIDFAFRPTPSGYSTPPANVSRSRPRFAASACGRKPLADTLAANALPVRTPCGRSPPAPAQGASRARPALAMVAPAFVLMCLLLLGPLLGVIALSFTDYQLGSPNSPGSALRTIRTCLPTGCSGSRCAIR